MPVYEYRCQECHKKYEIRLTYSEYDAYQPICPQCSSNQVQRIIRKIRVTTNDFSRLSEMADPSNLDAIEDDPRKLGKMMRDMREQVGAGDLPGEFDEVVDRLEKGQSPDEIDQAFPDLGND